MTTKTETPEIDKVGRVVTWAGGGVVINCSKAFVISYWKITLWQR